MRSQKFSTWSWIVLLPVAWFSLCWQVGERPIQIWDEARLAVNAAEMLRSGQWVVSTYMQEPDLWNTKPPLLLWLQALSLHAFGFTEWAFRLPTTLAAGALVVLVVRFARRWLGGPLAGLLTGLALLTSKGFVTHHVARSGDYDTLLLLFLTAQVLAVFSWLQTKRRRHLFVAGIAVGLAVLTKSVAGLFFLPGLLLAVIHRGRFFFLLKQPATWLSVALALGIPASWYVVREQALPGYLLAVWQNELGGRYTEALEEHAGPWYFYLTSFFSRTFLLWTPWVLVAIGVLARRPRPRPAYRFLTLTAWVGGVFLLSISSATTKLVWYDAPMYPLLALLIGAGLTHLIQQLTLTRPRQARLYALLLVAGAFLPAGVALYRHVTKLYVYRYEDPALVYGHYVQDARALPGTHPILLTNQYNSSLEFYALARRQQAPTDTVEVVYNAEKLVAGQVLIACGASVRSLLTQKYRLHLVYQADSCATYRILAPR